jgi:hypothetical protein
MSRHRSAGPRLRFWAVTLIIIVISPAVLLGGELVNRHYLGRVRAKPDRIRPTRAVRYPRSPEVRPAGFLRRLGRPGVRVASLYSGHKSWPLAMPFVSNPVWIMLTAPGRWILDRFRSRAGQGNGRGGGRGGPPSAGVREPRRPRPDQPAGVLALPEPPTS